MAAPMKRTGSLVLAQISRRLSARRSRDSFVEISKKAKDSKMLDNLERWFWREEFWLPPNMTWDALKGNENMTIPQPRNLWLVIPTALTLFVLRLMWERFIALPIGRRYGLQETPPRPPIPNALLEETYKKTRKVMPDHDSLVGLSKQLDWSTRQVERWWRRRRMQGKLSEMQRFRETSWRFTFYIGIFATGLYVLWDKPWLWDTAHCWIDYPRQHVPPEIWWYYIVELGFYCSLMLSLFMDGKRKDFGEMLVHHFATLSLLAFSWSNNMVRMGSTVTLLHDSVDYWLEGAKLAKYLRYQKLCDSLFVIFAVMWLITRLILYPIRILASSLNEGHHIIGAVYPVYYLFNSLMCILQVLHIIWFYYICRMLYSYIVKGQVDKDERSDTEPESSSEEEEERTENRLGGGGHSTVNHAVNNNLKNGMGDGPHNRPNRKVK